MVSFYINNEWINLTRQKPKWHLPVNLSKHRRVLLCVVTYFSGCFFFSDSNLIEYRNGQLTCKMCEYLSTLYTHRNRKSSTETLELRALLRWKQDECSQRVGGNRAEGVKYPAMSVTTRRNTWSCSVTTQRIRKFNSFSCCCSVSVWIVNLAIWKQRFVFLSIQEICICR